uniref:CSON000166 protein n=1 Tax=Culicoides sonorensis TaxID=179676 RepID=A0A336LQ45_CULSO
MATLKKESLDERLERIRKKNEELEKKHQETERDRLLAKVQGALVDCKANDDDWPKEHKFDKLDFTYDVPADKLEAEKVAKLELQQRRQQSKQVTSRGSKFTDIPQDPKSFLADEERDDKTKEKLEKKVQNEKRDRKQHQQQPTQQTGRQIVGRRQKKPTSTQDTDLIDYPEPFESDLNNFTNLTVSVSKDGDYKSVRLSQAPLIGSGRVGPRQITKTQFQGFEPEIDRTLNGSTTHKDTRNIGKSEKRNDHNNRPFNKDQKRNMSANNNNFRVQQKPTPFSDQSFSVANPMGQSNTEIKLFSVQDRLKKAQLSGPLNNNKNTFLNLISTKEVVTDERN